jgi:hypothetical protein
MMKRFVVLVGVLIGCSTPAAPAMAPAPDGTVAATAARPGTTRVVFVRPATACDTADHAIVVDEGGTFVGALLPGTAVATDVAPGRHAFLVWPGMDLRNERTPPYRPVGVLDETWGADQTRVVRVDVATPPEGRGHCYRYNVFHFDAPQGDVSQATADLRLLVADVNAGQAFLRGQGELTAAYFTMGLDKLDKRRAAEGHATLRARQVQEAGLR